MAFDCTQVLDEDFEELCNISGKIVVGCLVIGEKKHSIFSGVNVIGRDVATCDIALDTNVLSKQHATIEVKNKESHLIYDMGSSNKTRMEKMVLEPQVRYNLENGTNLYFGNVHGQYLKTFDHVDSLKETMIIGEKKMETLQLSIMKRELNKPSAYNSQFEIDSANSGGTLSVQETNCENCGDGDDNIFDLETQCEQDNSIDGDDPIFDMQTQECGENNYISSCKIFSANEDMKDRSLLEDDSDIFDNLVLEESHGEIPCTVEGKVEQKHLLHEVVQESDDSGDETDPENIFMAETQKFHTEIIPEMTLKPDDDSISVNLNFKDSKTIYSSVTESRNEDSLHHKVTSNKVQEKLDDETDHECESSSIKANKNLNEINIHSDKTRHPNNDMNSDSNNVNEKTHNKSQFARDITEHDLSTQPGNTQNVVSQEGIPTINVVVNTRNAQTQIANDAVILSEVVRRDIPGSHDDTNDLIALPTHIMMCNEMVGKVINKRTLDMSREGDRIDDTLNAPTQSVSGESTVCRVIDQDDATKGVECSTDEDVANTPTQISDIMHTPTELVKNEIDVGKIVHQDPSVEVGITCDPTDALTQIVTGDLTVGKVVHQSSSGVLAEHHDVQNAPTQVVNKMIHHNTCRSVNAYGNSIYIASMSTQVDDVEIAFDGMSHQDTSVMNNNSDALTHIKNDVTVDVNSELTVGKVIQQESSAEPVKYGSSEDIILPSQTVATNNDDVKDALNLVVNNDMDPPLQFASNKLTVEKVIHHGTSVMCEDVMASPTQVSSLDTVVRSGVGNDITNEPTQVVTNEVTVDRIDQDMFCRSDLTDDTINAPTQIVTDEVIVTRDHESIHGKIYKTDYIMDAPTQILEGEAVDNKINHHAMSGSCYATDIITAPSQMTDEVAIKTKYYQDMLGRCDVIDNIMSPPTQMLDDEVTSNKVDYKVVSGRCHVTDDIMNAPTQIMIDQVTATKEDHQAISGSCDVTDDIMNAPIQIMTDQVTATKEDHQAISGSYDVTDDIMNAPTQIITDEVGANKEYHQYMSGSCDVTDIMNAPTQIMIDEVAATKINHQAISGSCDVTDDIMNAPTQIIVDEVDATKVDHHDMFGRCDVTDDIMNAPTQMMTDDLIVSTGELIHQDNDITNVHSSPQHIKNDEVTVGSVIHQEISVKLEKYVTTEDNLDVSTQITQSGEMFIPSTKTMEESINDGKVVHVNKFIKCEIIDVCDASTQILGDEIIVEKLSYQNDSFVENDRIVIDDLLNNQKKGVNEVVSSSEIIQQGKLVVHKHSGVMSAPTHVNHDAIIGEVVHQDNPVAVIKYDEMDTLTQAMNVKQLVHKADDKVPSECAVDVSKEIACEARSVGRIIHQNTSLLLDNCDEDVMDAPTQIAHEERIAESKACQQNTAVVLSHCDVKNEMAVGHSNENNDYNNSAPEVIVSPVLCSKKHLRSGQIKPNELFDDAKLVETFHIKTEGVVELEVSTLQENKIEHPLPSSSLLKTSVYKQNENNDKDTVQEVLLRKPLVTYSSKQSAAKKEPVVKTKSLAKKPAVSLASCPKKEKKSLDISEHTLSKKSNKRGISLEEIETHSPKKACGGLETKSCSVQSIWPGKHRTYPGKKEFSILKNSIEADTPNNVGELLTPENKHPNASNECETLELRHSFVSLEALKMQQNTGNIASNRKRKRSSTPEDNKHLSPVLKLGHSQDIHIMADITCTRPKRNRKMTWKMLELEKTSPTPVKTVTRNIVEKKHENLPSVNSLSTKAISIQNVHDSVDNKKGSLARGSKCQSMLKVKSPVGPQRGNGTCKVSAESVLGEGVIGETTRIKNSSSSSNGNNSTSPKAAIKMKVLENLPLRRNWNCERRSSSSTIVSNDANADSKTADSFPSFTLEETCKEIQSKQSMFTRSSRKCVLEKVKKNNQCRKNSMIKQHYTSKDDVNNEVVIVDKTKNPCSSKDLNSVSNDELDVKKDDFQNKIKNHTIMSSEGVGEKKVQKNKYKRIKNYLKINSKVDELNTSDGKNINESTEKIVANKCFVSSEEKVNKILQENKVKTGKSLNENTILIADMHTDIPEVLNSNIPRQTRNRSTTFKETLSKHKRIIKDDANSSNKKENMGVNKRLGKKPLQIEETESQSPSESYTSEKDNVNTMFNSQRNGRMTGSCSRKQTKHTTLPKVISSSVPKDERENVTDKTQEDGSQLTPKRTYPKRLTNVGKGQNYSKKNIDPAVKTQVMFTGLSGEQLKAQEAIVERLGGCIVDQPGTEMVLVAQKLCRTIKMLCAIARGIPIVNCSWLTNCNKKGQFIGTDTYILQDREGEKKFQMSLHKTLLAATQRPLLTDYSVMVTPHVVPVPKDMKFLVESCGGVFLSRSPRNWPAKVFVISCKEDKSQWQKLRKVGVPVVGPEVILSGVLRHEVDLTTHLLDHC